MIRARVGNKLETDVTRNLEAISPKTDMVLLFYTKYSVLLTIQMNDF